MPTNNLTNIHYTGDGVTFNYAFPFEYIKADFVKATIDGVPASIAIVSSNIARFLSPPPAGSSIRIYRETPDSAIVVWVDGAVMLGKNLNLSQIQSLHIAQEAHDYSELLAEEVKQSTIDAVEDTVSSAVAAAQVSAAAAGTSADNAQEALASFNDIFLGALPSNPAGTITTGALYWNTSANEMRVWNGSEWTVAYVPETASGVLSFNGRSGAVSPAANDYSLSDITGLTAALAGKAPSDHTHSIASVSGLQTALDGKQPALGFTPVAADDYSDADVLNKIKNVHGEGSGLDADLWHGASFTVSTEDPSGGSNGDFWFKVEA